MPWSAIGGMIAGASFGSHFGPMVKSLGVKEGLVKGAAIGLFAGAAAGLFSPDVSERKGAVGNIFSGALSFAIGGGITSFGMTGLYPGGFGSKLLDLLGSRGLPKLAEWGPGKKMVDALGMKGVTPNPNPNEVLSSVGAAIAAERGTSIKGPLGWYGAFGPHGDKTPNFIKYFLGTPNVSEELLTTALSGVGTTAVKDPTKEFGKIFMDKLLTPMMKDMGGSAGYAAIGGAVYGGLAAGYYEHNRVPNDGTMGVYGGGMYRSAGLASNRPLNPVR